MHNLMPNVAPSTIKTHYCYLYFHRGGAADSFVWHVPEVCRHVIGQKDRQVPTRACQLVALPPPPGSVAA